MVNIVCYLVAFRTFAVRPLSKALLITATCEKTPSVSIIQSVSLPLYETVLECSKERIDGSVRERENIIDTMKSCQDERVLQRTINSS